MASPRRSPSTARRKRRRSATTIAHHAAGALAALAAACVLAAAPAGAAQAPAPPPAAFDIDLVGRLRAQDLYLEVLLGERTTGIVARVRMRDGRLAMNAVDLAAVGVVLPPGVSADDDGFVGLDALAGLSYRYDAARQQLILQVPPGLRPVQQLGYRQPAVVEARRDAGALLSYDAYARGVKGAGTLAVGTTLGWFGRFGRLDTSGVSRLDGESEGYRRLDTHWSYSDPVRLWTWTAGDFISSGLPWTRPVRLAGLQWRRNFGVRPDLITLPMPHFSADAVVPSTVELFVNNVRQFGGTVQDGPFVLDTLPRISGAGQASLVVTDALGRVTQTTVPLYVDYQRLAKGLTSFSVEAGLPRRHFAGPGDGYGRDPAVSASGRRGVFESLTVEGHGEATSGLGSAGVGMVWSPANRWGLATASYARAWGDTTGGQYALGYQFNNSRVGVDVQTLRRHDGYRDLGDASADDIDPIASTRAQDRGTLWVPLGRGSLALSVVRWRDGGGGTHRTRSLSWTQNVGSHLYVSASAFDDRDGGRGGGLVLSIPLGTEAQASATVRRDDNGTSASAALWRRAPYAGGWGWRVQGGGGADSYAQAAVELRGRAGETTFGVERRSGSTGAFFQGGGSVALMDGRFFLSRPIHDAFAVVSTDGVADVPVLSENRPYGRTNGAGYLLIPELRGWQRNRVAIDPDALGAAYRVGRVEQDATPADGSGVLVAFDVTAVNPAVVVLLGPDGTPAAAGSRGRIVGTGAPVLVGFDGEAYIENVRDDTVIEMEFGEVTCRYPVPASADGGQGRPAPLPCVRRAP